MYKKTLMVSGFCHFTENVEAKNINNSTVAVVGCAFNIGKQDKPETVYGQLTFWGNDATTVLEQGYAKGHFMYVEGSLSLNAYVNKHNTAVAKANISVTAWRSLEKKRDNGSGYSNGNNQQFANQQNANNYQPAPQNQAGFNGGNAGGFNNAQQNNYQQNNGYNQAPPQNNSAPRQNNYQQNSGYNQPQPNNNNYNQMPKQQPQQNAGPPVRGANNYQQTGSMPYSNENMPITPDDDLPFD